MGEWEDCLIESEKLSEFKTNLFLDKIFFKLERMLWLGMK